MNRRGTEPYARWCGRTAGETPPPTRFNRQTRANSGSSDSKIYSVWMQGAWLRGQVWVELGAGKSDRSEPDITPYLYPLQPQNPLIATYNLLNPIEFIPKIG